MGKKEGGRTLNPADKLRKEQRAKESKKNAERRAATRAAKVNQQTEEELQAELASVQRAVVEGRADGKQMAMKKQIEARLAEMEKEAAAAPVKEKTLEEQYPDAEGSMYYHPIENPYGVPPPGCLPMWKPGYVLKAHRHLLPRNHPLHPDFNASTPSSSVPTASSSNAMDITQPDDLFEGQEDDELAELDGIPPAPEEVDSDGENPPPAPPTTEEDVPNVVYEDEEEEMEEDGGYIPMDDDDELASQPPPAKRPALPRTHFPPPYPARSPQMPMLPPFIPPGMPMPPHMMPFPPGGPPPGYPPHSYQPRSHGGQQNRGPPRGQDHRDHKAQRRPDHKKDKEKNEPGAIPDPLDMGPYRKEGAKGGPQTSSSSATPSSSASSTTGPATAPPAPSKAPEEPHHDYGPMLVPASVRVKRNAPTQSRAVAPKRAAAAAPAQPASSEFADLMADINKVGARD